MVSLVDYWVAVGEVFWVQVVELILMEHSQIVEVYQT
jgi:hypothetical protein